MRLVLCQRQAPQQLDEETPVVQKIALQSYYYEKHVGALVGQTGCWGKLR